ncbi:type III secretion system chaperone family protein [Allosaccharopolyspora coralli]|uniref:hypothetical protein n=1 Tax=Allosaccharopolyspora coralli TaxID=2665642 RepID=UPI00165202FE|nr:hypothetical protein [Allosaccharopolyspora coralli]
MGIPAWLWFAIAVVALGAGGWLLLAPRQRSDEEDTSRRRRSRRSAKSRERSRWAALRGWQFVDTDQVLPSRWERGVLARYSGIVGTDVVAGTTFTADGRRPVYVLDLDVNGRTVAVVAAVRCHRPVPTTVELWLPDVPAPKDEGLDLLGPVGTRYAFVADSAVARPLITSELVAATDQFGEDVTVTWLENDWALAAAEPGADPEQVEQVLRALGDLADVVDPFEVDPNAPDAFDEADALEAPDGSEEAGERDEVFDFESPDEDETLDRDPAGATVVSLSEVRQNAGRSTESTPESEQESVDETGATDAAPDADPADEDTQSPDDTDSSTGGKGSSPKGQVRARKGRGTATVDLGTPDEVDTDQRA